MTEWDKKKAVEASDAARKREMDDFWDVEKLLPDRPARRVPPSRRETPSVVEVELTSSSAVPQKDESTVHVAPVSSVPLTVTVSGRTSDESAPNDLSNTTRYVPPHKRNETNTPVAEYKPDGVLLHVVRVYGWQAGYHYFDGFVEDALCFDAKKPSKPAEKASFFSYFPQYTQLSPRAEAWYLCWREYAR